MTFDLKGLQVGTETANGDLSGSQFLFVQFAAAGVTVAGAGAPVDGVLQGQPIADQSASVLVSGVSKMVAGAAVLKGAEVMSSAAGKAITATAGNNIVGRALEAATADDDIIAVLISKQGIKA